MTEKISLSEALQRLPELLEAVQTAHQRFLIVENGEERAALVHPEEFHRYEAWCEEQQAIAAELEQADAWEAEHPEQVEQWWYQLAQASLARLWEHPDEDLYSAEGGDSA